MLTKTYFNDQKPYSCSKKIQCKDYSAKHGGQSGTCCIVNYGVCFSEEKRRMAQGKKT